MISKVNWNIFQTAVNSYTRALAGDEERIISIALNPGWIQTDMGGSNAPLTVNNATEDIIKLISNLTKNDSGSFLERDGKNIPF